MPPNLVEELNPFMGRSTLNLDDPQDKNHFASSHFTPELHAPRGPVAYDSSNHCQILFQCFGSLWPRVLPYCVVNVLVMIATHYLQVYDIVDWKISSQGHSFAGMIVSFLVVSRINTALTRYNECRGYLGVMYRESRELIQTAFCFSRRNRNQSSEAKQWRAEVAYRSMIMLRTAISVIMYRTTKVAAWEVDELTGPELEYATPANAWRRHAQTPATRYTDSLRIPMRLAYLLRESICSQVHRLANPLQIPQELKLLSSVDSFMNGYFGMRKFLTTPVPFPLIQMTRTIVLIYVFTLPLVFLSDDKGILVEHCIVVFFLTYGFVGLELVSIELDDPFGDDENDFDCLAFARMVFEDTYMMINDSDGVEWADKVRNQMHERAYRNSLNVKDVYSSTTNTTTTAAPSPRKSNLSSPKGRSPNNNNNNNNHHVQVHPVTAHHHRQQKQKQKQRHSPNHASDTTSVNTEHSRLIMDV